MINIIIIFVLTDFYFYLLKTSKHKTAFGNVAKYLEVKPDETNIQSIEDWDNAIQMASDHFSRTMVNVH